VAKVQKISIFESDEKIFEAMVFALLSLYGAAVFYFVVSVFLFLLP
jgi:hypothetical protein